MGLTDIPLATKHKLLGAKIETTPGTAESITAALAATEVYDIKCFPNGLFDDGERRVDGNYDGTSARHKGLRRGKVTFRQRLRHGDGLFTLLQGCGFKSTGVYSSSRGDRELLTLKVWESGRIKVVYAANGTFTVEGTNGQAVVVSWDFDGVWQEYATAGARTEAMPADPTLAGVPYFAQDMTLTFDAAAIPLVSTFTINPALNVIARPSVTHAGGLAHCMVNGIGQARLTLDPEARLPATHDALALLESGDVAAVQMVLTDGTNSLTIDMAAAQRLSVGDEDGEGTLREPIECELHNPADDFLSFTASGGE